MRVVLGLVVLVLVVSGVRGRRPPPLFDHGVDLPTTRPLNIAHRGSSGRLPEHTVEAYQMAVQEGCDVIECDLALTRDLQLICSHESWLSASTNIADVFPEERMSTYFVQDQLRVITDYFSVDFTLAELKQVKRRQKNSYRDPNHNDLYDIASFDEYVGVAQGAGRPVGIYPETKDAVWTNSLDVVQAAGTTFEDLVLEAVVRHGYDSPTSPCFLQSFNENSVRYMSERTNLPLIMLGVTNLATDDRLDSLAQFCYGIGPPRSSIVRTNSADQITDRTDLIERAHARGLRVHPFTLRNEDRFLAWDYGQDPQREYDDFLSQGADGVFTDFPGTYAAFLDAAYNQCQQL